jgi:lipoate-protein ligase A
MLIVESQSKDVYRNLAIEEYLMDQVTDSGPVLFLWQSDCAVVMGKNQNPWRECRLDLMEAEGVPLARRISGGGTVYHDPGNLNYCVIVDRTAYQEAQAYEMVFHALKEFGIDAEKTGKSNLSVNGRKFSGNAFSFRKGRALHHGTLLLDTDLQRLNRYLGSMFEHIDTHAIASVPAEVMNLDLDVSDLSSALKRSFHTLYDDGSVLRMVQNEFDESALQLIMERQVSDVWKFETTPRFFLKLNELHIEVVKGRVQGSEYDGKLFRDVAFSLVC